jgi:hypothetical protein
MADERIILTATIPNGASVTGTIDCNSRAILGFVAPAAWTAAALNAEVSVDGVTWSTAAYDSAGAAVGSWSSITAGAGYAFDLNGMIPWRYIRLRSGTSGVPVAQGADRVFSVIQRPLA